MGQWGAYGYAVDQGWTSAMILDHYYGGTHAGSIGSQNISVRLSSLDARSGTWITSDKDFTVGSMKVAAGSAARLVKTSGGWVAYTTRGGCSAPNNYGPYAVSAPVVKLLPQSGTTGLDTLVTCANGRGYRGQLSMAQAGTELRLVNTLPMEEYLRSVVPSESPASWADARRGWGVEALKAQAVAARSYAWSENRYSYAKTCDTISCQVYGGATNHGAAVTDSRSDRAVAGTAGVVRVTSSGAVARTEFSASTGGYTVGPDFTPVLDQGDRLSPYHVWTTVLDGNAMTSRYSLGAFVQLKVTRQNGLGVDGGRALEVQIIGSRGTRTLTGAGFQAAFGLNSDWFFPVVQPRQQVTFLRYVKTRFAPEVYRQFGYNGWQDHSWVTADDYAAVGRPPVSMIPAANVKYPWSPTQYVVTPWATEPMAQTFTLSWPAWQAAGFPSPARAGNVYGTMFYRKANDPSIYAEAPDGSVHHLTPAEWAAAGKPRPVTR